MERRLGSKNRRNAFLLLSFLGLLLVGAAAASAYFTDRITASAAVLHAGMLRLEYPDEVKASYRSGIDGRQGKSSLRSGSTEATPQEAVRRNYGIVADFSELDGQLYPYQTGDSIRLSFRTQLSGNTGAYLVPKLSIHAENQAEGDRYTVYASAEGERETALSVAEEEGMQAGDSIYYGQVRVVSPGEEQQYDYRISLDQLSESSAAAFTFDFSVAAVQQRNNQIEGMEPVMLYHEIEGKEAGGKSQLCGFTDICGRARMVDTDGAAVTPERGKQILVEMNPQVTEGAPAGCRLTWYRSSEGGEEVLISDEDGRIRLLLNGKTAENRFRYEIQNEAGIQTSPLYHFEIDKDTVHCRKEAYVPDFSTKKGAQIE